MNIQDVCLTRIEFFDEEQRLENPELGYFNVVGRFKNRGHDQYISIPFSESFRDKTIGELHEILVTELGRYIGK
ncbi:hypothetical protein [Bacillus litorisediminis]|uniref:hypothetical protein n=1 Tax=Bacillus litorisediminis TaxID=2922713 RepID=UPI001FAEE3E3|nr:hypothetical protein [Bacillus litorisediminis]